MMASESVLPNFLIVGMAKCGTSSLSKYLQQHPDIFISEQKEPRFLSSQVMRFPMNGPKDDLVESWYVKDFESYKKLFQYATQNIIGEASADTLYFYQGTIPIIKQYLGNPKIIIIIRNPVKRAMSAYTHLLRDQRESLSFEEALMHEHERISNNYELIYHYKEASKYFEPIQAFMKAFEHVKVILNEDLQRKPQQTLSEIFDFLGAKNRLPIDTSVKYNQSGLPKNKMLQDIFQENNMVRRAVRPLARTIFPSKERRMKVFSWITGKNLKEMVMEPETKALLINEFKDDIYKTSALINKDLNFYLK